MNESQIIAWLKTYVFAAPEVQLEMISGMAQRFGRLQRDLATRNELLGSAQNELRQQQARIAELEAQLQGCLVQVDEDEDLHCRFDSEGITVKTMYSGTAFLLYGYAGDVVHLPAGYCIAKVQPAE